MARLLCPRLTNTINAAAVKRQPQFFFPVLAWYVLPCASLAVV